MHGVHVLFWNVTVLLQPQERPDPTKPFVMHVLVLTSALLHTARHALAKVSGVPKMRQPSWGKPRTAHPKELQTEGSWKRCLGSQRDAQTLGPVQRGACRSEGPVIDQCTGCAGKLHRNGALQHSGRVQSKISNPDHSASHRVLHNRRWRHIMSPTIHLFIK